jgi:hypothetical protein
MRSSSQLCVSCVEARSGSTDCWGLPPREGLASEHAPEVAAALQLLCVHRQRLEFRFVIVEHMFKRDPDVRVAALTAGAVIDATGTSIICRQVCHDPLFHDACLLHVLHASTAELEELASWSREPRASEHVGYALGYSGRKLGIAAVARLADESAPALAGFRLATGFDGDAEEVEAWWSSHESRFDAGVRYLRGRKADLDGMKNSLRRANARLWTAHRLECLVLSHGRTVLPSHGSPSRLLQAIDGLAFA